ncbi:hypothetical protein FACS1894133_3160 [Clostridia bacterium]|nr:hypothetical protein FACS1894133_3160 [Clostridia bacterium]
MKKRILILSAVIAMGALSAAAAGAISENRPRPQTLSPQVVQYRDIVTGEGSIVSSSAATVAVIAVGEGDIRKVKTGQTAKLTGAAFDSETYTATVRDIAAAATRVGNAAVVEVTLAIDNPDAALRSGYTARADIAVDAVRDVIALPYTAILQDAGGEFVYVLDGGEVRRRDIVTGAEMENETEVTAGLRMSDKVVAHPDEIMP